MLEARAGHGPSSKEAMMNGTVKEVLAKGREADELEDDERDAEELADEDEDDDLDEDDDSEA
jgi:hypothetical protein